MFIELFKVYYTCAEPNAKVESTKQAVNVMSIISVELEGKEINQKQYHKVIVSGMSEKSLYISDHDFERLIH